MKKLILMVVMAALSLAAMAQHEEDTENGVVSLAGREGFTIETKKETLYSSPICWYRLVQISIGMMMKVWIKRTIRIM